MGSYVPAEYDWLTKDNKQDWAQFANTVALSLGSIGNKLVEAKEFGRRLKENQLSNEVMYESMRNAARLAAQDQALRPKLASKLGVDDTPEAVFERMLQFVPKYQDKEVNTSYAQRLATSARDMNDSLFEDKMDRNAYLALSANLVQDGILNSSDVYKKADNMANYQELETANEKLASAKTFEEVEELQKTYKKMDFSKTEKYSQLKKNKELKDALDLMDQYDEYFKLGVTTDPKTGGEMTGFQLALKEHIANGGNSEDMERAIQQYQNIEAFKNFEIKKAQAQTEAHRKAISDALSDQQKRAAIDGTRANTVKVLKEIDRAENGKDLEKMNLFITETTKGTFLEVPTNKIKDAEKKLTGDSKKDALTKNFIKQQKSIVDAINTIAQRVNSGEYGSSMSGVDKAEYTNKLLAEASSGQGADFFEAIVERTILEDNVPIIKAIGMYGGKNVKPMDDGNYYFERGNEKFRYNVSKAMVQKLSNLQTETKTQPQSSAPNKNQDPVEAARAMLKQRK